MKSGELLIDDDSMDEPDRDNSCDETLTEIDGKSKLNDEDESKDKSDGEEEDEDMEDDEDTESEDSDSLDEEEAETRRSRYVSDMNDLEKQFADLKEQLYKDRITQIEEQLHEVNNSEAKEFTGPLKQYEQECIIRIEVADRLKVYRSINLENKLQCELQAAQQHFENEERALFESLKAEFNEKLKTVEEERLSSEIYSDLWSEDSVRTRKKKKGMEMSIPEKRKKPVTVSGPYIVYMLNEMDILEDWAAIRKAKSELARRRASGIKRERQLP